MLSKRVTIRTWFCWRPGSELWDLHCSSAEDWLPVWWCAPCMQTLPIYTHFVCMQSESCNDTVAYHNVKVQKFKVFLHVRYEPVVLRTKICRNFSELLTCCTSRMNYGHWLTQAMRTSTIISSPSNAATISRVSPFIFPWTQHVCLYIQSAKLEDWNFCSLKSLWKVCVEMDNLYKIQKFVFSLEFLLCGCQTTI